MKYAALEEWAIDRGFFIFVVALMVVIGIVKDLFLFGRWFDRRMNPRRRNHPEAPLNNEHFDERTSTMLEEIKTMNDIRLQSILSESQKTNDLLHRFMLGFKIIAKSQMGIDLDI